MLDIRLYDVVETKKKHPCGNNLWTVIRVGADIRIKCNKCGHTLLMDREKYEKCVKNIVEHGPNKQGDGVESI